MYQSMHSTQDNIMASLWSSTCYMNSSNWSHVLHICENIATVESKHFKSKIIVKLKKDSHWRTELFKYILCEQKTFQSWWLCSSCVSCVSVGVMFTVLGFNNFFLKMALPTKITDQIFVLLAQLSYETVSIACILWKYV